MAAIIKALRVGFSINMSTIPELHSFPILLANLALARISLSAHPFFARLAALIQLWALAHLLLVARIWQSSSRLWHWDILSSMSQRRCSIIPIVAIMRDSAN